MEWDVGTGRTTAANKTFKPGQATDQSCLPPLWDDAVEHTAEPFNLDLQRYIVGAWQRRYIGAAIVLVITAVMALIIHFAVTRQWQASTTLIKRSHQDRLSLAEREPFRSQDYSLETLLDMLKLPSSLENVRRLAGLNVKLTTLATAIDVSLGRDSKILNLKVTWPEPEKSAELANLLARTFIDRTRLLLRDDATAAHEYYRVQLDKTRQNTHNASADLLAFRQKHGISNLDAETRVLLEEMSGLQTELNARQAEVGALQVATSRLVLALKDEPEQVITYTIYRSPLKSRLADYDWDLREAQSKYTAQNPKVIKLEERIAALKQMIAANNDEAIPENTYTRNTKREEMELRLQLLADDIKLREAQAGALGETLASMKDKVARLSDHEKDYLLLQSRLDGILVLENELARRVEETRLVKQRNGASFDIVEKAVTPTEAQPSGRKLMAVASLVFALSSGFVLIMLLEWRDPMVRSTRDVKDITGGAICVEIPAGITSPGALIDQSKPIDPLANLYRGLSNDLAILAGTQSHTSIAVLGATGKCGRSTVAANLATTLIIKGQSVLLVDADLRQSAGNRPGELLDLPGGHAGLREHLLKGQRLFRQEDKTGNLQYIAAGGDGIPDDQGLFALGSTNLAELLKPLQKDRFTIVDLPPLEDFEVALEMATEMSLALLVIRSGEIRRDEFKKTVAQLNRRGIDCSAAVLIDVPVERLESTRFFTFPQMGDNFRLWSTSNHA